MIHSYPSVYAIGHKAIEGIFNGPVIIEEKVDGSQFSFGVVDGELMCRSKGKQLLLDAPEKMFTRAVETAKTLACHLRPDWVYRCEYLEKPKHNTLAYDRVPIMHLIGFDICPGLEEYLSPNEKRAEFIRLGLECVPLLYDGEVTGFEMFSDFLQRDSVLGGCKVEGVVVKNYSLFTGEKKVAMGKYVSEGFKETHAGDWKQRNPSQSDILTQLIEQYRTDARWQKAVQHLRDAGSLEGSPRDIALLIREIPADVRKECEAEIKELLFAHFWPKMQRGITAGFADWYKAELAKAAFE